MGLSLDVLLSPADYQARQQRGFAGEVCVVFDVLRATSVIVTGLANGAAGFIPVTEIFEAVELRKQQSGLLLAGEREGVRITAVQSGTVEFDLGNSPREYTRARVSGRTIVATTTNGTRALRVCVSADAVMVGSFLNLAVTSKWLLELRAKQLVFVCAGTGESMALEDVLCAGALCDLIVTGEGGCVLTDAAQAAQQIYRAAAADLVAVASGSSNGRRLLANPELSDDVKVCLQRDCCPVVARLGRDGVVRREGTKGELIH